MGEHRPDGTTVSRLKVVFFDAAGTLFHITGSVGEVYVSYAGKYGFPQTPESRAAVEAAFRRAFSDAPPPIFAVSDHAEIKRCERLWWFDIVHAVFYRVGMFDGFDEYFGEVFQAFEGASHWTLYPETIRTLKVLRAGGAELGIISNFDTRLFNVLRGLELTDCFDTVTIPGLTRAAKPSARIFRAALEKHAVDPDEAVHVGDSQQDDVEGAAAAGMTGVWLDRGSRGASRQSEPGENAHRIESLEELPALLAALDRIV